MKCLLCFPEKKFKNLEIKKYKYWRVELRKNQNYLGWCFIILNRHVEDLMDITREEQQELFQITKRLRNVLKKLFNPDLFNYAALGNKINHTHLQVIPRYEKEIKFLGINFKDQNWGRNYSPYDQKFVVSEKVLKKIKKSIQETL